MVIKSGMFNSVNDDRVYYAEDFASYFASFIGNGVFPNPSTGLQIIAGSGMNVLVKPGRGWAFGYYLVNTEDYTLTLDVGEAVLKRIDRVVMRLNYINRAMEIVVKKGTYASAPVAPALVRNADVYEMGLADIAVNPGTIQITQANITDLRLNSDMCGIVHGLVNQVDTTTIFNQYQSWFNQYSNGKALEFDEWQTRVTTELEAWILDEQNDFNTWRLAQETDWTAWSDGRKDAFDVWFATIQGILDTNAAGNLLLLIDAHKDATLPHKYKDAADGQTYLWGMQRNSTLNAASFMYAINEVTPPNVINLPTWEQVNGMQTEIINSSGRLAAKNGSMYKIKTIDDKSFLAPEGSNNLSALVSDYQTRFPSIAPYVPIETTEKWHVRDEVYVLIHTNYIVIFDLASMKVLNAVLISSLANTNFINAGSIPNYFVDDKYIYVRGVNTSNVPSFGVFNKTTGAWVNGISPISNDTGGVSSTHLLGATKLPCIDGIFFLSAGSGYPYILSFAINYDTNGIPQSFTKKQVHPTQGGSYIITSLFDDGQFIYDIYYHQSNLWYVRKSQYNKSTNTWTTIAVGTNTAAAPSSASTWTHVYIKGIITFAVVKFGVNQPLIVFRLDTLQQYQVIMNSTAHRQPTFDYVSKNKMWVQYNNVATIPTYINGNYYEVIMEMSMNNDATWDSQWHWVPLAYSPILEASPYRRIFLGPYAIMKNGEVLVRNDAAYQFNSAKLKPIKLLEGYQV